METGVVASWKVSIVCVMPSSITVRSSRETERYERLVLVTVNSMTGRTGGGFGAK